MAAESELYTGDGDEAAGVRLCWSWYTGCCCLAEVVVLLKSKPSEGTVVVPYGVAMPIFTFGGVQPVRRRSKGNKRRKEQENPQRRRVSVKREEGGIRGTWIWEEFEKEEKIFDKTRKGHTKRPPTHCPTVTWTHTTILRWLVYLFIYDCPAWPAVWQIEVSGRPAAPSGWVSLWLHPGAGQNARLQLLTSSPSSTHSFAEQKWSQSCLTCSTVSISSSVNFSSKSVQIISRETVRMGALQNPPVSLFFFLTAPPALQCSQSKVQRCPAAS